MPTTTPDHRATKNCSKQIFQHSLITHPRMPAPQQQQQQQQQLLAQYHHVAVRHVAHGRQRARSGFNPRMGAVQGNHPRLKKMTTTVTAWRRMCWLRRRVGAWTATATATARRAAATEAWCGVGWARRRRGVLGFGGCVGVVGLAWSLGEGVWFGWRWRGHAGVGHVAALSSAAALSLS